MHSSFPHYTFSQSKDVYTPITYPQLIDSGKNIDNQTYKVRLPFDFNLDNAIYRDIFVGANGYISLGATDPGPDYWMLNSYRSGFSVISGMDADLAGHPDRTSELSYTTTGVEPNQICCPVERFWV